MDLIKTFYNGQFVTKVSDNNNHSYYMSRINNSAHDVIIIVCENDNRPVHEKVSISSLPFIYCKKQKSDIPKHDIKTSFNNGMYNPGVLQGKMCKKKSQTPLKSLITFTTTNPGIDITIDVKNKDTSIFYTEHMELRQLLQNFNYTITSSVV